jgi:hypothetical protein
MFENDDDGVLNERETKDSSFKKFGADFHNEDHLDSMMNSLNVNESKHVPNTTYLVRNKF